jgi:hypothetical protein
MRGAFFRPASISLDERSHHRAFAAGVAVDRCTADAHGRGLVLTQVLPMCARG